MKKRAPARTSESEPFIKAVSLRRDDVPEWNVYPFALTTINNLAFLPLHPRVTFFVGENGSGKSTLLEAIAVAGGFNAEGGSRNFNFATRESHSQLSDYLTLVRGAARPEDGFFLRAESFHNVATEIERLDAEPGGGRVINNYGGVSLHEMSHGESFFALFINRLGGGGLYLMDEPEAALSPSRQMSMLARMHVLVQNGSQFIIATHSPILMAYPNATILAFSPEDGIKKVTYEETEHYFITREFLNNRERMLSILLAEA